MATTVGAVLGRFLLLKTIWMVINGDNSVSRKLQLRNQYFSGHTITLIGAFQAGEVKHAQII